MVSKVKHAIIYTRVSTEDQRENYSLSTQLEALRARCASNGYTIIAEFAESHTAAELEQRAMLQEALHLIDTKQANILMVYSQDRLTRDQQHLHIILYRIFKVKAKVEVVVGPEIESTPVGKFIASSITFTNEMERLSFSERSMRGRKARVATGKPLPSRMTAYGLCWNAERTMLIIDEDTAPIVIRIFVAYVEGATCRAIARQLTQEHILTPSDHANKRAGRLLRHQAWNAATVSLILRNRAYLGEYHAMKWRVIKHEELDQHGQVKTVRTYQNRLRDDLREETEDTITPTAITIPTFLDPTLFYAAQRRAEMHKSLAARNNHQVRLTRFRGFVYCGYCGHRMYVTKMAPTRHKDGSPGVDRVEYRCTRNNGVRGGSNSCSENASIGARSLDAWAWQLLKEVVAHPDLLQQHLAQARAAQPISTTQKAIEALQERDKELQGQVRAWGDMLATPLDRSVYTVLQERIKEATHEQVEIAHTLVSYRERLEQEKVIRLQERQFYDWLSAVNRQIDHLDYPHVMQLCQILHVRLKAWRIDHEPHVRLEIGQEPPVIIQEHTGPLPRPKAGSDVIVSNTGIDIRHNESEGIGLSLLFAAPLIAAIMQ